MRDVELVVRYFAIVYFIDSYTGNLKRFFDETVEYLNRDWKRNELEIKNKANELNNSVKRAVFRKLR